MSQGSTLKDLLAAIETAPDDAALVFATDGGQIGAGYHVTELKLARITGIDCGKTLRSWSETQLQLLDGHGRAHMPSGVFRKIAAQSVAAIPELQDGPLRIEFAHGNAGLQIHKIDSVEASDTKVTVTLSSEQALCKPAAAYGCCSPTSAC